MRYDKRNQKAIRSLHPKMKPLATLFLKKCKELQLDILIYEGYRSFKKQKDLYAKGRTAPGSVVTNAREGQSWHNFRLAFDCVPTDQRGNCLWERKDLYMQLGRIGEEIGLKWGGKFYSIKDLPHFEYHPKLTIKEALERYKAKLPLFDDEKILPGLVVRKPQPVSKYSFILTLILDTIKKALRLP